MTTQKSSFDRSQMLLAIAASIGLLTLSGLCTGCHDVSAQAPVDDGPQITADSVTFPATLPVTGVEVDVVNNGAERGLQLPGRLTWDEDKTTRIFTPFAGRVTEILVQPGEKVKAGQTLAVITSPDFGTAQSEYRKAQAALQLSRNAVQRQQDLFEHGVIAAKDLQQAQADYATAKAESDRTSSRIKLFGDDGNAVSQRYALKSPIAGVVVEKNINPGQELRPDQPGAPQFVVTDPSTLWVQLDAAEADLNGLIKGMPFTVHAGGEGSPEVAGHIEQVADYLDPTTRTVKLRGVLDNSNQALKSEMFVSAKLPLTALKGSVVPASAVILAGDKHYVFIAKSATSFARREVQVGVVSKNILPVISGLQPGEKVVTQGAVYLAQMLKKAQQS